MLTDKSVTGRAVVIGAGVMGAGIAAMLANVGWSVDLLDRVPEDAGADRKSRDRLAREGLERALKARPPHLALPEYAARVRVGNVEDDLERAAAADWVVEAAAEDAAIKRAVLEAVARASGPRTVVSSNTSGLSLSAMVAGCPARFRRRFLGSHFFNPPRYMRPVELIPAADTDPAVFEALARFADRVLGKRVIRARDTPGFISTRLGMYSLCRAIQLATDRGLTVEQADYLTGPLLGRPRTGTFRLADVVGLDITARIADHLAAALPSDAAYQELRLPEMMRRLIAEGRTGAKAGAGFYTRDPNGVLLSLDLKCGEYRPRVEPVPYPAGAEAMPLNERLPLLWNLSPEHDGGFLRDLLRDTLGYVADVTPEVSDRIVEVDDALIGGFAWEVGPFHMLDAIDDAHIWPDGDAPDLVAMRRAAGRPRFYMHESGRHAYFDFRTRVMAELVRPPDVIVLKDLKRAGRIIQEWDDASLVDLGDGVACLEWRTKMGTVRPELLTAIDEARRRTERDFAALILAGAPDHFSAGFDLQLLATAIETMDWSRIASMLTQFQKTCSGLKYASVPVVCAAKGYTLGGGCEVMLHAAGVQAAFESSIGLPEANAGLIPAGGGPTQLMLRVAAVMPPGTILEPPDPYPFVSPIWTNVRLARYSSSAAEAQALGFMREADGVTVHPDRLLHEAKERALASAASYRPPTPIHVEAMGASGLARFQWEVHLLRRADRITDHDARIAVALARIFCGGGLIHRASVVESYLLELEREEFLALAGAPETLPRIRHLLATGRPLRN